MNDLARRDSVVQLEELMQGIDTVTDWAAGTTHHFSDGVYMREVRREADSLVVGKIHRHACMNVLLEGSFSIEGEHESGLREAPCIWASPAGNKRAIYYHTDCRWMTVHANPTNTHDLDELERLLIADSYAALEEI